CRRGPRTGAGRVHRAPPSSWRRRPSSASPIRRSRAKCCRPTARPRARTPNPHPAPSACVPWSLLLSAGHPALDGFHRRTQLVGDVLDGLTRVVQFDRPEPTPPVLLEPAAVRASGPVGAVDRGRQREPLPAALTRAKTPALD